jgi:hypothetical protein
MADETYGPKVYMKVGGDEQIVANGGLVTVESGGVIGFSSGGGILAASGSSIILNGTVSMTGAVAMTGTAALGNLPTVGQAAPAAAGSSQTDATALTKMVNIVTGADGTKGVRLPAAVAGEIVIVVNTVAASHALKVYPPTGGKIDAGSANAALSLAAAKRVILLCDGTDWWSLVGA